MRHNFNTIKKKKKEEISPIQWLKQNFHSTKAKEKGSKSCTKGMRKNEILWVGKYEIVRKKIIRNINTYEQQDLDTTTKKKSYTTAMNFI